MLCVRLPAHIQVDGFLIERDWSAPVAHVSEARDISLCYRFRLALHRPSQPMALDANGVRSTSRHRWPI